MLKAVIDIGTNSVKLCMGEVSGGYILRVLLDVNKITKLGEKMGTDGKMIPEAISRTAAAVADYVKEAESRGCSSVTIVGTMALRSASNADELKKCIKSLTNIDVRTLSGAEEAELSYRAATSAVKAGAETEILTFDTGGGSTEFVYGKNGSITEDTSINIGAVRITEKYFSSLPVSEEKLASALEGIKEELKAGNILHPCSNVVAMGGNVTSMAAIALGLEKYDAEKVQGSVLSLKEVLSQVKRFASSTVEEIRHIPGLNPARAEIILAGAAIVLSVMEITGAEEITVCDRGLRHELLR